MSYGKVFLLGFFMLATAALYAWFGPSRYVVTQFAGSVEMHDVYSNKSWNYMDLGLYGYWKEK